MPPKKKKSGESPPKLAVSADTIHQIWTTLTRDSWYEFLMKFKGPHNWFFKGRELWGNCVYHNDPHASFHVRFDQGYAKCFGQCNKFESDPIAFASRIMNSTYGDAFNYLVTTYGLSGFSSSLVSHVKNYARQQEMKQIILSMLNAELVDAAANPTENKFSYAQKAVNWLAKRNIPTNLFHALPLGVIPPQDRLWARLDDVEKLPPHRTRWHTEVQEYFEKVIPRNPMTHGAYEGWVLFANHLTPSSIGRFRAREPQLGPDKQIIAIGDADEPLGFFGLSAFQTIIGNDTNAVSSAAHIVEGEFCALAAMVPQIASGNVKAITLAAGGNNNNCLDPLMDMGFAEARIIGDRDAGGKTFVSLHMRESHKIKTRIFDWPQTLAIAKDLHDSFMTLGGDAIVAEVAKDTNYQFPQQWGLAILNQDRVNIPAGDVGRLAKLAMQTGELLNNPTEREVYLTEAATLLGIPDTEIKKCMGSVEDEIGFTRLLARQLERSYMFLYQENTNKSRMVTAWNKKKRCLSQFDLSNKGSILGTLKGDLGALTKWVSDEIGEASWLRDFTDDNGNAVQQKLFRKEQEYQGLMVDRVVPELACALPMRAAMTKIGQGVHYKNDRLYVINGTAFCRGDIGADGSIAWTDLDGPADGDILIETGDGIKWSDAFSCAADILQFPKVDLAAMVARARDILDTGWVFKKSTHHLEIQYLASFIFVPTLTDVFNSLPWVFVKAPKGSGKSTLTLGALSSNNKKAGIQLIEASFASDKFTEPAVRDRMRNVSKLLVLDEFDVGNENDRNLKTVNRAARAVLASIRGAQRHGGNVIQMNTSEYQLRFPLVCSGIDPLLEGADVSRFNFVELENLPSGPSGTTPESLILDKFTRDQISELRQATTMFALQNLPRVGVEYEQLQNELKFGQHFVAGVDSRFRENLLPILTIMKMAGMNYKEFASAYSAIKTERLRELHSRQISDDLWTSILHTPGVSVPSEEYKNQKFTIAQLMNDPHKRALINDTNTGVYYVEGKDYLAVSWATASSGILRGSSFGGRSSLSLRETAGQDKRVLGLDSLQRDPLVIATLRNFGLALRDVSIIPISHFVSNAKIDGQEEAVFAPAKKEPMMDAATADANLDSVPASRGEKHNI